jgi:excisionase family DNA binding protein
VYRRFLAASEELSAQAVQQVTAGAGQPQVALDDPATAWVRDAAPVMVDRVGAALLAGDGRVLLDYLGVELAGLRRAAIPEVHLIRLLDAVATSLPDDPSLPEGFEPARRILIEGRDHLLRAGARPVCSMPALHDLPAAAADGPHLASIPPPGQAFTDLLLLGTSACQASAALLSVPQPDGSWSTLSYGLQTNDGWHDSQLFTAMITSAGPLEIADLVGSMPHSPLVHPPHSMRWAYGVALRRESGSVIGVVVVLDQGLRQVTRREQEAMGALAEQIAAQLEQWRRLGARAGSPAAVPPRPPAPAVGPGDTSVAGPSASATALLSDGHHLLRSQEVAEIFDVTERTVINWAAAGKLPSLRTIGGHLRFRRADVLHLLAPPDPPTS